MKNLKDINSNKSVSEYLKNNRDLDKRIRIYETLQWAKDNPTYDFKGIMKDAPAPHKLQFSNKEVYKYLMEFKSFMENDEYKLLTDDRPPAAF